jgi:hypothetical protein
MEIAVAADGAGWDKDVHARFPQKSPGFMLDCDQSATWRIIDFYQASNLRLPESGHSTA